MNTSVQKKGRVNQSKQGGERERKRERERERERERVGGGKGIEIVSEKRGRTGQ